MGSQRELLAAQRAAPESLRGQWELPGGKVEEGESDQEALVRECREELGVAVVVGARVGADLRIGADRVMRVYRAELLARKPRPLEHLALRWVVAEDLGALDWLPTDRPLLPALADLLTAPG